MNAEESVPRAGGGSWLGPGSVITKSSFSKSIIVLGGAGTRSARRLEPGERALVVAARPRWEVDVNEVQRDQVDAVLVVGRTAHRAWFGPTDVVVVSRPVRRVKRG